MKGRALGGQATVAVYPVRSDAEIARARLAADGIASWVFVDDEGGLNPGFYRRYGVRLVVDSRDVDDARESLGIEILPVPIDLAHAIARHAAWAYPQEACGLVLFDGDAPVFVCGLTNVAGSAHRFTIDPAETFGAHRFAVGRGWRIGALFHSHVRTAAYPSEADIGGGADPEWLHLVFGPVVGRSALRAYRIEDGAPAEVSVVIGA